MHTPHLTRTLSFLTALILAPGSVALAQPTTFAGLLGIFGDIINLLIPFIIGLILITIMWGVIKAWIMGEASEGDIERGKMIAFVGVIVLVVLVSVWGILYMLRGGIFGGV